jgi:hypothetical protein
MPPQIGLNTRALTDPVEFSMEDAVLNTWVEDTGNYLRLDPDELAPPEEPVSDQG